MKHLLRLVFVTSIAGCLTVTPHLRAEGLKLPVLQDAPALLLHSSQGYLGIDYRDLDNDRARTLKVRDGHGVEVVTVDHDAPAGKAGLRVHDVILQLNGQSVDNADQLHRMLHDIPAGGAVNFLVSRGGSAVNVSAQLVDRAVLQQEAWPRHYSAPEDNSVVGRRRGAFIGSGDSGEAFSGGSETSTSHGFMGWSLGKTNNLPPVGATVDPLGSQLADYFGVKHGVLIKSVDDGTPAANAGLKAGDVVLKIGQTEMKTPSAWEHALRSNEGKSVPVTILRDHKQQILTLTLQPGTKKHG